LLAWLRQVLAHVLGHEFRRYAGTQQRDVAREVSLEQSLAQSSQRLGDMLAVSGSSPSQQAVRHEQEVMLAEVLVRLPDDYREVLILRNLEGLSHEEIAERMGRGVGAVRMLWVRALARLRKEASKIE
jgi:RNA polymerase sigma-70 factor (ECF subfamily)